MNRLTVDHIWNQQRIPVAWRKTGKGEKLLARLPYAADNKAWLGSLGRVRPVWNRTQHQWELPKAWFNTFVDKSLARFGSVYIIQPYREQEKCSPACQNATGHECQCSCMGEHHGAGNDGSWFEVSDTFATRWGREEIACRLLSALRKAG
ncbi:hypothetical protein EOA75_01250 [Mesorhizobium sp. M1A.F.Ca.IN.022.07.1.1]|uniref:hypothetical protein n=1 Tax=Mesorhizobium sp. M1A.F.Ca.IN.022.07.1.1 TaxID=2496767 RepID=UPI000FCAA7DF|nr:hypothetical protein [Mesorhizobium sp. M1A.F.Ca.IN.022.07.1.1]RUV98191.1 hypothetical protein EOA75_01250 [Mesorhizobium sp. M1A.F.Ca.IN.022.07.1.1]TIS47019.1 MAG: hypothetical protein E5X11_18345 [Mesorhizobium sp.]